MTNKQDRFYVVSESDLAKFAHGCALLFESQRCLTKEAKDMCIKTFQETEAACRARPVPELATHFALFDEERPYYTPDDHEAWVTKSWRIEK